MGDRLVYSGLPEAYFHIFGEPLRVGTYLKSGEHFYPLYKDNPYAEMVPWAEKQDGLLPGLAWNVPESYWRPHYVPKRVFHELTGMWLPEKYVNPNLYRPRRTIKRRLVVCDEAGWACRRGYPYLDDLVAVFTKAGWETICMRNLGQGPQQVQSARHSAMFFDYQQTIRFMETVELFVGYESAIAHICGALRVPYVMFCGGTPSQMFRHLSCVYAHDSCVMGGCNSKICPRACLNQSANVNDAVLAAVEERVCRLTD